MDRVIAKGSPVVLEFKRLGPWRRVWCKLNEKAYIANSLNNTVMVGGGHGNGIRAAS